MRHPGIEPGAPRWQRGILPLNQWRFVLVSTSNFTRTMRQDTMSEGIARDSAKMVFEVGFEPTPPKRLVP